jgi:hypothetical protein
VLGLDPSLTNMGWALHDDSAEVGTPERCAGHGRFQTPAKQEFILRYMSQRESLRGLVQQHKVTRVGLEFPVFGQMWSEGMYGLFLFVCEALRAEKCDVVFWSPMQVKAHARDTIERPPKWVMEKPDMVEAAAHDVGSGRWNHNEADAYLVGVLSARFWRFLDGDLLAGELTPTETRYFTEVKVQKAGKSVKKGMIYREDERFFAWSH